VRYVVPGDASAPLPENLLRHALQEFALAIVPANQLLLIRTPPGAANALAQAIDRTNPKDVAGTIAGDDTILVVPRDGVSPRAVERTLRRVMVEG
jgi:transcriptional regulator of arginine metabolism